MNSDTKSLSPASDNTTDRDAARYRWLRDVAWDQPGRLALMGDWCFPASALDRAIDAAMDGRVWGEDTD